MQSIDPRTGAVVADYDEHDATAVETRLARAAAAFETWRATALPVRAALLTAVAKQLRDREGALAHRMAVEMGKPVTQGVAEVRKCAWVCEHYAEHGASMLAPEATPTDATRSYVCFAPLGAVLAVMPWNFPLWQVFRFAAPALAAGNVALLKHASNVCGAALDIEAVFLAAGAPPGLFTTLLVRASRVADLIGDPRVRAVSLTGSTAAGRSVASVAGAHLKKVVLELGGSDPYLVLDDADLDHAAAVCATSRLLNAGQSCIAGKRFIVVASVADEFVRRFVARMAAATVGDPLEAATEVGPLARHDLRDELHAQVTRSVALGAVVRLGGHVPPGPGAYYPPTVLVGVTPGMPAFDEELFGPVAAVTIARDANDAVRLANQSPFGLGACVLTVDVERGEHIAAHELDAGSCFVNDFVRSDPRLPFGGIKDSGYGRELGRAGILEFVNAKTVYVR